MTVGFDATSAIRQGAGIGRYTRELLTALSHREDDFFYRLFCCSGGHLDGHLPQLDGRFRTRAIPVSDRITNAVWYRARVPFPVQAIVGSFDLFHSPDFTVPPTWGKPSVVTIHDLAFLTVPDCAYPTLRAYLEEVVPRCARSASRIIAVSENTKRDIIALLKIPEQDIIVIHEGVSSQFGPMEREVAAHLLQRLGVRPGFILSVGTLEPRKNYVRLLEAYARLRDDGIDLPLIIAGGRGWMYEPIFSRVTTLKLDDSVVFVRPSDRELVALYSMADVFVYPSLYEGFGIPPLEALACRVPVTCSNTSSLPEAIGDAAVTFDPLDVDDIADSIHRVLSDASLRRLLQQAGPPRAARFTWEQAAEKTVAVYQEVLGCA